MGFLHLCLVWQVCTSRQTKLSGFTPLLQTLTLIKPALIRPVASSSSLSVARLMRQLFVQVGHSIRQCRAAAVQADRAEGRLHSCQRV